MHEMMRSVGSQRFFELCLVGALLLTFASALSSQMINDRLLVYLRPSSFALTNIYQNNAVDGNTIRKMRHCVDSQEQMWSDTIHAQVCQQTIYLPSNIFLIASVEYC